MGARSGIVAGEEWGILTFGVFLFVASILFVVMVHESGHFIAAKLFRFKATKFFVGFGPTIYSRQKGETEYGVKAFPLGGFVKIIGMSPYEEVAAEDEPRSYPNKPRWQRAILLVAGSATHWVVAFVLLLITAMVIGFPTDRPSNSIGVVHTRVEGAPVPAGTAGIRPGDEIVAVGGRSTRSWNEITQYIQAHGGDIATFTILRDDRRRDIDVRLGHAVFNSEGDVVDYVPPGESVPPLKSGQTTGGFFGVTPEFEFEKDGPIQAIATSATWTWRFTKASVTGIPDVFAPIFDGRLWENFTGERERGAGDPVGLVGAGRLAGESVQTGRYLDFIGYIVYFTIFVGIMNLLPLPPLDGGHLAVVGYEAITGRTVDVRKLIPIAAAVISFFVVLFLMVLYLDLVEPISF
jgi:membrane-associated protease RseP (regulator of RpoE activity)